MLTPAGPNLCHALAARRKARYLSRLYDGQLAPAGLSVSQFSILSLLEAHERLRLTDLASLLIMERTSLVRALKPLQSAGLVVSERPDGGRAFDIRLSAAGLEKFAWAVVLWNNAQAMFEAEIGQDRAVRLRNEVLALDLGG
jgi:DNA-binding MarR family transcriptional regulator